MDFFNQYQGIFGLNFHVQEIFKSTTHNPGLHPTSLTMIYPYPHLTANFHHNGAFSTDKMKGDVANNLVSRCHCSQLAAD
jgi:hypothetical protein